MIKTFSSQPRDFTIWTIIWYTVQMIFKRSISISLKIEFRTIIFLRKLYFRDLTLKIDNFILFIYINAIQTDVKIPACDWLNQCVGFYQLRCRKITEFRFEIKEMIMLVWRRHRKNKINFIFRCWFEEIKALCCLKIHITSLLS